MAKKKVEGLNVKLVKSLIGCKDDQIATANSLGLFKIGDCRADTEGYLRQIYRRRLQEAQWCYVLSWRRGRAL